MQNLIKLAGRLVLCDDGVPEADQQLRCEEMRLGMECQGPDAIEYWWRPIEDDV